MAFSSWMVIWDGIPPRWEGCSEFTGADYTPGTNSRGSVTGKTPEKPETPLKTWKLGKRLQNDPVEAKGCVAERWEAPGQPLARTEEPAGSKEVLTRLGGGFVPLRGSLFPAPDAGGREAGEGLPQPGAVGKWPTPRES